MHRAEIEDMGDIYGAVQNIFAIQVTAPSGGFFPGHLGVEVTASNDLAPSYRSSELCGAFMFRPCQFRSGFSGQACVLVPQCLSMPQVGDPEKHEL